MEWLAGTFFSDDANCACQKGATTTPSKRTPCYSGTTTPSSTEIPVVFCWVCYSLLIPSFLSFLAFWVVFAAQWPLLLWRTTTPPQDGPTTPPRAQTDGNPFMEPTTPLLNRLRSRSHTRAPKARLPVLWFEDVRSNFRITQRVC